MLSVLAGGRAEALTAGQVLVTSGRRPNSDGFGLEEAGVALLPNGGIKVDDRMRTSKLGVYAAGDVTGRHQFVYMAAYGARIAAENALNGNSKRYDATAMPAVVFTDPQVASVGVTEAAARAQGLAVKTSTLKLSHVPRARGATPAGSSSWSPRQRPEGSAVRISSHPKAPTASRPRRSPSRPGSRWSNWLRRSSPISRPSKG